MVKRDVVEIKKQFSKENCSITKLCGCYVNGEKEILSKFTETFLNLEDDESFKYLDMFKKTLSGTLGKNLLNLEFDKDMYDVQEKLLKLRDSELKDEDVLNAFYDEVVATYDYAGNYFITLIYAAYDIPAKTKDNKVLEDGSEEVYRYILCTISPVELSKPGLSFNPETAKIETRTRDWVVSAPCTGFIYPAFTQRTTDIHSLLYYSKNSEELHEDFVLGLLGCIVPMSAGAQKDIFHSIIKQTLGEDCDYAIVKTINEKLNARMEEQKLKDTHEPVVLSKADVKSLLIESGVEAEHLEGYDELAENKIALLASNVVNQKVYEVKTSDVVVKVNYEKADLVQTKMIDGRKCIVIDMPDSVEVNGLHVKA